MDSEQIKIFLAVFIGGLIVLYIILKILQRIGKFFINVKRLRDKKRYNDIRNQYDENYQLVNTTLLELNINEAYNYIKFLYDKLISQEIIDLEDLDKVIYNDFKNQTSEKILKFVANYSTINEVLGTYLNSFDDKKIKFHGYMELEQYHSLSTKIPSILNQITFKRAAEGNLNLDKN
tara:strand:- start:127 stop:657 length:531 start_codon:yes stop_codon:yes gene_type:complete